MEGSGPWLGECAPALTGGYPPEPRGELAPRALKGGAAGGEPTLDVPSVRGVGLIPLILAVLMVDTRPPWRLVGG